MRLLLLLSLFSSSVLSAQSLERVDPPHWWVGMRENVLQLALYGDGVAALSPVLSDERVQLLRTVRTENPNYLFLYLQIDPAAAPGPLEIELREGALVRERLSYELRARDQDSATRAGFDAGDAIYLVTPDRFANGDPGNDSVAGLDDRADRTDPVGRHGGDLRGVIDHLDYIGEMGFTALWLNPVVENAMPRASYHGYAITDFYRIDPRFGSNADYRELVRGARERGIKVVMDMVMNHCGSAHRFATDPPSANWINFRGHYVNTNHRRTAIEDPHAAEVDRERFASGWFVESMPDLNQREPLLADFLIQNSIWWVEEMGLGGIRMDTYSYPDKAFMARWTCALLSEYPNFNIVGEEWFLEPPVLAYWQRGAHNRDGYTSCLPSLMDFPLQHALAGAMTDEEGDFNGGWARLYQTLALDFVYPDPGNLVVFADNHDMDRWFTQVGEDPTRFKLGLAFVATTRGVPQFYYGTEIMMCNSGAPGDHGVIRTDFPGGWEGDPVNAFTGVGLRRDAAELQQWLRRLLNWRKGSAAVRSGRLVHYAPEDEVYVFFRDSGEGAVMVVLNRAEAPRTLALGRFAESLGACVQGREVFSGETLVLDESLTVPAGTAWILELE